MIQRRVIIIMCTCLFFLFSILFMSIEHNYTNENIYDLINGQAVSMINDDVINNTIEFIDAQTDINQDSKEFYNEDFEDYKYYCKIYIYESYKEASKMEYFISKKNKHYFKYKNIIFETNDEDLLFKYHKLFYNK